MVARPPGSSIGRTVPWRPARKPAYLTRPLRLGFALRKGTCFPGIQKLLRVETTEKLDQLCDYAGPTGLMAGPEARAVIAVEVLVEQDVILVATIAPFVRLDQVAVGKCRLRILVEVLHVGVCRRAVEVEVIFLNVFAVVGLTVRQAEHAFFEDGVLAIPQGHAEAQQLLIIADAGKTILTPMVGA